jgi:hypothetical protein
MLCTCCEVRRLKSLVDGKHVVGDGAGVQLGHLPRVGQDHSCSLGAGLEGALATRVQEVLVVSQVETCLAGLRDDLPRFPKLSDLGPIYPPTDVPHKVSLARERGCHRVVLGTEWSHSRDLGVGRPLGKRRLYRLERPL